MTLLSPGDIASIKAAIMTVTDTFMVTPVIYRQRGESLDRFNEDRGDQATVIFNFNALVEYPHDQIDEVKESTQGALDMADIHLTMNLETLDGLGYIDAAKNFKGAVEKDYFTVAGILYKVSFIGYDGPLDAKNVLVLVYGKRYHKNS